jgi:hypothetical protein
MTHTNSYLHRTFEYYAADQNGATLEIRIGFSYSPGTRHSHPRGHWNAQIGTWDPPDDPEREMLSAEREVDGKWVAIADTEWLYGWCADAFDKADDDDLASALPDREEVS